MNARAEWLVVGGPVEPWVRLGLTVVEGADGAPTIPLFGTGIRIDPAAPAGLVRWQLSGLTDGSGTDSSRGGGPPGLFEIDGLVTEAVSPATPVFVDHPSGAVGLDHVVVSTNDLDRTCSAIEGATGAPLRRVREVGAIRQGFHRLGGGGLIVEVVEHAGLADGPASFWGLVVNVEDLDAAAARRGPDVIGDVKPAVQPGRQIATVREGVGLGLPVALMTP